MYGGSYLQSGYLDFTDRFREVGRSEAHLFHQLIGNEIDNEFLLTLNIHRRCPLADRGGRLSLPQ